MPSSNSAHSPSFIDRARKSFGWWLLVAAMIVLSWQLGSIQQQSLLDELEVKGRQELDLYVSHLAGQIEQFSFLPALLGDDQRLRTLLLLPDDRPLREEVNQFLRHVNQITGSLDVYLMDKRGVTIAASNWQDEITFIGRNFAFRPYFKEAMQGQPGRYYALGTTSGRRGYYFSYPVGAKGDTLGVIVVKIQIDTLENDWGSSDTQLLVTDPDGVIFIATQPEWRYRTIRPLSDEEAARVRESRRYPDAELRPISYQADVTRPSGSVLVTVGERDGERYLSMTRDMPKAGWRIHLLVSQAVISPQVVQTRLFAMSTLLLLVTGARLYTARDRRRRERETERRAAMQEALDELEQRVGRRTKDLTEANRLLRQEIEEHEHTRDELIQAAKLAALGQMSAGINHELNQPLAAMRTYADNARTYLARENLEQAAWNLQQISELTGRMAQISGQLKVFSRKASGQRIRVSLRACLDGARRIVMTRVQHVGAELSIELPADDLFVAADPVQLEQVLVNLIGNACDVLQQQPRKHIRVCGEEHEGLVVVSVSDTGPGIAPENLERIFDPFFTTTESGLGLGLSISHTIVQRLGGTLTVDNAPEGGAVFHLALAAWQDQQADRAAGGGIMAS